MSDMNPLLTSKQIKIRCYINIAWGLLTCFILLGGLLGKQVAVIALAIIATMWVAIMIVRNMFDSFMLLRWLKSQNK